MNVTRWRDTRPTRIVGTRWAGAVVIGVAVGIGMSCAQSPVAPAGSVTISTPAALAPANGAQIAALKQPITLTVNNAFVADGQSTSLYEFEVAADPAFTSKMQSPTAQPGTGQTSVVLSTLPAGLTYYWHVRATAGGTVGTFSATSSFVIGPNILIGAPTIVAPTAGATPTGWPLFTVTNASRSGTVAPLTYRFDISTSNTFASVLLTATVPEGNGQTSFATSISTPFPAGTLLFWRVTAIDAADGVTSNPSATQTFTPQALTLQAILAAQLSQTLWPGAQPSGTNGHARLGDSCDGSPNWAIVTCFSPPLGINFQSPTIEALRFFDLFDRGYDPPSAITWMVSNGYPTVAQWYPLPEKGVLGIGPFYLAARDKVVGEGTIWDIVIGLG